MPTSMPSSSTAVEKPRIDMELTPVKIHLTNSKVIFRGMTVTSNEVSSLNKGIVYELRSAETFTDPAIAVAWFDGTTRWFSVDDFSKLCTVTGMRP